jgi:hypothetical protein
MTFKLSQRSLNNLKGVDERLQRVVEIAITKTENDFGGDLRASDTSKSRRLWSPRARARP